VVTPLRLAASDTAILVDRGWLPAADAATARPQDHAEPGARTVRGVVERIARGAGGPAPRRLAGEGVTLWSVRALDADSLSARLAYPVAPYVLRESPGPGVPASPRRSARRPHDEAVHIGYAFQWFLFAALILAGTAALAWSRARRAGPRPIPEVRP
jgi:surfeit locus 1 family protein